jgi:membrane protease YdiL (CAAX protease family)
VLGRGALIVLPVWALYVALSTLATPAAPGAGLSGESVLMLVIVLLTTPLQAAGEEYGARGLINRAAASWVSGRGGALAVGTIVSSAVFMVAHGAGDPWLITFYFLFGVGLSLVTWRTGGLEVAILIHTVNNMVAFGISILSGQDLSNVLDRSDGTGGPAVLVPMGMLVAIVAGVWWWAGHSKLVRTFQPAALPPPPPTPPG